MADTALTAEEARELFDTPAELDLKVTKLAKWVKHSKHAIAFTGAGVSTAAGIPDFRSGMDTCLATGPGAWELRARDAARPAAAVTTSTLKAIPTLTHRALVALHARGTLAHVVSQNTDGLHRRSGVPIGALSELHGNSNLETCTACGAEYLRDAQCRSGKRRGAHDHATGRTCGACGGDLHDSIINFGESLPEKALDDAFAHAERADVCISLGSSLRVVPAADVPARVGRKAGGKLIIVNLQATPLDGDAALLIRAKCDDVMRLLLEKLGAPTPPPFVLRRAVVVGNVPAAPKAAETPAAALKRLGVVDDASIEVTDASGLREGGEPADAPDETEIFALGVEPEAAAAAISAAASGDAPPPMRPFAFARRVALALPAGARVGGDGWRRNKHGAVVIDGGDRARVGVAVLGGLDDGTVVQCRVVPQGRYGEPPLELAHTARARGAQTLHVLEYDPVRGGAWTVKHAGPCPVAFLRQIGAKRDGHRRASEKVAPVEKEAG